MLNLSSDQLTFVSAFGNKGQSVCPSRNIVSIKGHKVGCKDFNSETKQHTLIFCSHQNTYHEKICFSSLIIVYHEFRTSYSFIMRAPAWSHFLSLFFLSSRHGFVKRLWSKSITCSPFHFTLVLGLVYQASPGRSL